MSERRAGGYSLETIFTLLLVDATKEQLVCRID